MQIGLSLCTSPAAQPLPGSLQQVNSPRQCADCLKREPGSLFLDVRWVGLLTCRLVCWQDPMMLDFEIYLSKRLLPWTFVQLHERVLCHGTCKAQSCFI